MADLIYKDESYKIVGACFEVYNEKGYGFTEPVYQECLQMEFLMQKISCVAQPTLPLSYKGHMLAQFFKPDFVCFEKIIVELKSVEAISNAHRAQVLNYLNATGMELGLIINFGSHPKLEYERLAKAKNYTIADEIKSWVKEN